MRMHSNQLPKMEIAPVLDAAPAPEEAVIDIPVASSMRRRLRGMHQDNLTPTIMRAPVHMREDMRPHFQPIRVSIGPFHRGGQHLQFMEKYKWKYLQDLISRTRNSDEAMMNILVMKMKELEAQARGCYCESIGLESDEFVEMMVLDGCFILSYLIEFYFSQESLAARVGWTIEEVLGDIVKLENQIPYFVLQCLFDTFKVESSDSLWPRPVGSEEEAAVSLLDLAVELLRSYPVRNLKTKDIPADDVDHIQHMLHLLQIGLWSARELLDEPPTSRREPSNGGRVITDLLANLISVILSRLLCLKMLASPSTSPEFAEGPIDRAMRMAADLEEAGVTFKRKMTGRMFKYSFSNGTLELSYIFLDPVYMPMYMNVVFFEQYSKSYFRFSTYVRFMGAIINTPTDVTILKRSGIIASNQLSDEEVANYFHQLSGFITRIYIRQRDKVYREINNYCASNWHSWWAALKRNYFSNPWSTSSVVAAIILLILAFLQTYFAMYSYFRPPHAS